MKPFRFLCRFGLHNLLTFGFRIEGAGCTSYRKCKACNKHIRSCVIPFVGAMVTEIAPEDVPQNLIPSKYE